MNARLFIITEIWVPCEQWPHMRYDSCQILFQKKIKVGGWMQLYQIPGP
jgi:hypothetical protein